MVHSETTVTLTPKKVIKARTANALASRCITRRNGKRAVERAAILQDSTETCNGPAGLPRPSRRGRGEGSSTSRSDSFVPHRCSMRPRMASITLTDESRGVGHGAGRTGADQHNVASERRGQSPVLRSFAQQLAPWPEFLCRTGSFAHKPPGPCAGDGASSSSQPGSRGRCDDWTTGEGQFLCKATARKWPTTSGLSCTLPAA